MVAFGGDEPWTCQLPVNSFTTQLQRFLITFKLAKNSEELI